MKQARAFDTYAAGYDAHFIHSAIGRLQRRQVWDQLGPYLPGAKDILEINCGTGEDAIRLAQQGHRVLATDASAEMIDKCRKKMEKRQTNENIGFLQLDFMSLSEKLKDRQFDLIFSNFGGLNCIGEKDTQRLSGIFEKLLRPKGLLFLVYMSRACLWERFYYNYKRDKARARRRKTPGPVLARIMGKTLNIWYYEPRNLQLVYGRHFNLLEARPVGLFVPPTYLEAYFKNKPNVLRILSRLDILFNVTTLANFADHFAIVFEKK